MLRKNRETANSAVNLSIINREVFMQGIITILLVVQKLRLTLDVIPGSNSDWAASDLICSAAEGH